jgi:hypothetical protein
VCEADAATGEGRGSCIGYLSVAAQVPRSELDAAHVDLLHARALRGHKQPHFAVLELVPAGPQNNEG